MHLQMVMNCFESNKLEFQLLKLPVLLLKGFNLLLYCASFVAIYRMSARHVDIAKKGKRFSVYEKNKKESWVFYLK